MAKTKQYEISRKYKKVTSLNVNNFVHFLRKSANQRTKIKSISQNPHAAQLFILR